MEWERLKILGSVVNCTDMKKILIPALLVVCLQTAFGQGLLQQSFGNGANAFTMDFVTIGNPEMSVPYTYNIGKYEVSRDMINKANASAGLGISTYDLIPNGGTGPNRPASGITWYEAATFVNWLNTSSGSVAAYKFDSNGNFQLWSSGDAGYNASNLFRNSLANYFLPSRYEWSKAAYGSPSGEWYEFANGSNSAPVRVANGTTGAVYGPQDTSADITNAGGLSPYGTMAQNGNVWEWTETAYIGINDDPSEYREMRGGSWDMGPSASDMARGYAAPVRPEDQWNNSSGFRVAASAAIPEPSSLSLLALGGIALALRKRNRV